MDAAMAFYKKLRGTSESVNYGDDFKFNNTRSEVGCNSNHAASRFYKSLMEKKTGNKKEVKPLNEKCENSSKLNKYTNKCSCGKNITVPNNNLSVMCSCGKVHSSK